MEDKGRVDRPNAVSSEDELEGTPVVHVVIFSRCLRFSLEEMRREPLMGFDARRRTLDRWTGLDSGVHRELRPLLSCLARLYRGEFGQLPLKAGRGVSIMNRPCPPSPVPWPLSPIPWPLAPGQLVKCESGTASEKPVGDDSGEEDNFPPMPDTFLLAEFGDHDKAYARWKATVQWRKDSGANVALATPHPRFDLAKKHYPTFFHGKVGGWMDVKRASSGPPTPCVP